MRLCLILPPLLLAAGCVARPGVTAPADAAADMEVVSYAAAGDTVRGVLCRPAGPGPFPAVIVVHGDFGLTDWVKDQARRLADRGYVALAVDLYRGEAVAGLMDAHILDRGLPEGRVLGDLRAAADYLAARPDVRADALGILGWDMGGGYALDAALHDPRLRAVVTCYGRLTTDPELLEPLRASVLGVFAGRDEGITPETLAQFRAAMEKAGKRVAGLHVYPDVGHGFLNPDSPGPHGPRDAEAAADAWGQIEKYLAAELPRR